MNSADQLVADFIIKTFREDATERSTEAQRHLAECPDLTATHVAGEDGVYGCDTGCEFMRLQADLTCSHGVEHRFTYGEFGDMNMIVSELIPAWSTIGEGVDW